jgi:hypothetical protein
MIFFVTNSRVASKNTQEIKWKKNFFSDFKKQREDSLLCVCGAFEFSLSLSLSLEEKSKSAKRSSRARLCVCVHSFRGKPRFGI